MQVAPTYSNHADKRSPSDMCCSSGRRDSLRKPHNYPISFPQIKVCSRALCADRCIFLLPMFAIEKAKSEAFLRSYLQIKVNRYTGIDEQIPWLPLFFSPGYCSIRLARNFRQDQKLMMSTIEPDDERYFTRGREPQRRHHQRNGPPRGPVTTNLQGNIPQPYKPHNAAKIRHRS